MNVEQWHADLRTLPQWKFFAGVVVDEHKQDIFASWLFDACREIAGGLDVRISGRTDTARFLKGEVLRRLSGCRSLGLDPRYVKQIDQLIDEVDADDKAIVSAGGLATVGFSSLVGRRGGAANKQGALRGWMVRMIAISVPELTPNRFATIAAFSRHAKVDCSPQTARSILLAGRT